MKIVIKIGGSIIGFPPNSSIIKSYADISLNIIEKGHRIVIVVGGGPLARYYINIAEDLGLNDIFKDELAISVSKLNAKLLAMKLNSYASKTIPTSLNQLKNLMENSKIVLMGGLRPGITTDAVAALVAETIEADLFVKATDQEGVFTKDPRLHPDAKKLDVLTFQEVRKISNNKHQPGMHSILDQKAVKVLEKIRTRTIILNGFKPENIDLAIKNEKIGTLIQ